MDIIKYTPGTGNHSQRYMFETDVTAGSGSPEYGRLVHKEEATCALYYIAYTRTSLSSLSTNNGYFP
ncbi:hypothetical protein CGGC5_v005921 [Colletotrichum fructicola Nara gc5]|uniref:Uncharacterized protein n=1 Tax=Colletotrichum fructicola (strain Nara gc5) TaxID=1213859 RepID=A0A7J6IEJ6_COLFN|nr:hypothetical protein CGGC5_v016048 [Colletotrichum fructicola Nara gc5]KAF4487496.1 hypothetical protein CGGC5_v005921 [Colletotrichum fructicola Nara gc5]